MTGRRRSALTLPPFKKADAGAIQALERGEAEPHQQRRVLKLIVDELCATYALSFDPENQHMTAFAEGRRFVGREILKLLYINLATLKD